MPSRDGRARDVIPVDADGMIDEEALDAMLAGGPALVAIQHVNNETGVIQPIERSREVRAAGSLLLADCAQSGGKDCRFRTPISSPFAAHKLGGPPGIGACWSRTSRR